MNQHFIFIFVLHKFVTCSVGPKSAMLSTVGAATVKEQTCSANTTQNACSSPPATAERLAKRDRCVVRSRKICFKKIANQL